MGETQVRTQIGYRNTVGAERGNLKDSFSFSVYVISKGLVWGEDMRSIPHTS